MTSYVKLMPWNRSYITMGNQMRGKPFRMGIQLMPRNFGWTDDKFRDQLMFALRGEALLFASNLLVLVREDTELLLHAMEHRFGQCLLAETANLNNIKKLSKEVMQQYSAIVNQLMTNAYPALSGKQGTGISIFFAIEHLTSRPEDGLRQKK